MHKGPQKDSHKDSADESGWGESASAVKRAVGAGSYQHGAHPVKKLVNRYLALLIAAGNHGRGGQDGEEIKEKKEEGRKESHWCLALDSSEGLTSQALVGAFAAGRARVLVPNPSKSEARALLRRWAKCPLHQTPEPPPAEERAVPPSCSISSAPPASSPPPRCNCPMLCVASSHSLLAALAAPAQLAQPAQAERGGEGGKPRALRLAECVAVMRRKGFTASRAGGAEEGREGSFHGSEGGFGAVWLDYCGSVSQWSRSGRMRYGDLRLLLRGGEGSPPLLAQSGLLLVTTGVRGAALAYPAQLVDELCCQVLQAARGSGGGHGVRCVGVLSYTVTAPMFTVAFRAGGASESDGNENRTPCLCEALALKAAVAEGRSGGGGDDKVTRVVFSRGWQPMHPSHQQQRWRQGDTEGGTACGVEVVCSCSGDTLPRREEAGGGARARGALRLQGSHHARLAKRCSLGRAEAAASALFWEALCMAQGWAGGNRGKIGAPAGQQKAAVAAVRTAPSETPSAGPPERLRLLALEGPRLPLCAALLQVASAGVEGGAGRTVEVDVLLRRSLRQSLAVAAGQLAAWGQQAGIAVHPPVGSRLADEAARDAEVQSKVHDALGGGGCVQLRLRGGAQGAQGAPEEGHSPAPLLLARVRQLQSGVRGFFASPPSPSSPSSSLSPPSSPSPPPLGYAGVWLDYTASQPLSVAQLRRCHAWPDMTDALQAALPGGGGGDGGDGGDGASRFVPLLVFVNCSGGAAQCWDGYSLDLLAHGVARAVEEAFVSPPPAATGFQCLVLSTLRASAGCPRAAVLCAIVPRRRARESGEAGLVREWRQRLGRWRLGERWGEMGFVGGRQPRTRETKAPAEITTEEKAPAAGQAAATVQVSHAYVACGRGARAMAASTAKFGRDEVLRSPLFRLLRGDLGGWGFQRERGTANPPEWRVVLGEPGFHHVLPWLTALAAEAGQASGRRVWCLCSHAVDAAHLRFKLRQPGTTGAVGAEGTGALVGDKGGKGSIEVVDLGEGGQGGAEALRLVAEARDGDGGDRLSVEAMVLLSQGGVVEWEAEWGGLVGEWVTGLAHLSSSSSAWMGVLVLVVQAELGQLRAMLHRFAWGAPASRGAQRGQPALHLVQTRQFVHQATKYQIATLKIAWQ